MKIRLTKTNGRAPSPTPAQLVATPSAAGLPPIASAALAGGVTFLSPASAHEADQSEGDTAPRTPRAFRPGRSSHLSPASECAQVSHRRIDLQAVTVDQFLQAIGKLLDIWRRRTFH